jgi:hypothetical protein
MNVGIGTEAAQFQISNLKLRAVSFLGIFVSNFLYTVRSRFFQGMWGGGKSYWIGTRIEGTSYSKGIELDVPEGGGRVER